MPSKNNRSAPPGATPPEVRYVREIERLAKLTGVARDDNEHVAGWAERGIEKLIERTRTLEAFQLAAQQRIDELEGELFEARASADEPSLDAGAARALWKIARAMSIEEPIADNAIKKWRDERERGDRYRDSAERAHAILRMMEGGQP